MAIETMTAEPENGNGNGAAQVPHHLPGQGYQRRIDRLVRDKHLLRQENDELRLAIHGYEEMIRKYKAALLAARRTQQ